MEFKVNPKFKNLIPPLTPEEYQLLEQNILQYGLRDAIVVWHETIIDGHNRLEIVKKHGLKNAIYKHMGFANEDEVIVWIIDNQLARRNLPPFARFELMEAKEPLLKKMAKANSLANLKQNTDVQKSSPRGKTRDIVEKETGMSHDTYRKAKIVKEKASPEILKQLRNGTKKINTAHRELTAPEQKPEQETENAPVYKTFMLDFKLTLGLEESEEPLVMEHSTCLVGKDKFKDVPNAEISDVLRALLCIEKKLLSWQGYDSYDDYCESHPQN